ncbi:MAG: 9-O-acetylesterase [Spirochaetes bacterium]|nr:9-O-acetylesterase [Spirochaetota bacterium]
MRRFSISAIICVIMLSVTPMFADVKMPQLFSDNMVLQRDADIKIFGFAAPGEKITITLSNQKATAVADQTGSWIVKLKPMKAGGPYTIVIQGNNKITLSNVLIGEIWIGSGQSNMEWVVKNTTNSSIEISNAAFPGIRLFTVKKKTLFAPTNDADAVQWAECSPSNVGGFSAVLYYYGRMLHQRLGVPVGLIHTSWGGTPAEAWTPMEGFNDEELKVFQERFVQMTNSYANKSTKAQDDYAKKLKTWEDSQRVKDPGNKGFDLGYAKADFNDASWKTMKLPTTIESAGLNIDGALWFRKTVDIPQSWAGKDLMLCIGAVDDIDVTYFNGTQAGTTGKEVSNWYMAQRRYKIAASSVKAGKAVIAVRMFDDFGGGGLTGPDAEMKLYPVSAPKEALALTGDWKYIIEFQTAPLTAKGPRPAEPVQRPQNIPAALYNAMIAPLTNFAIRGAIWYQGESNAGRSYQYRKLFRTMIETWRKAWNIGDFPFYFVQLANYMKKNPTPVESGWAELREAQTMTLSLTNTGQAVIIDVGEEKDIHPKNKQDVGRRLALQALKKTYGKRVASSGPMYRSMQIENDAIRVSFDYVAGGLTLYGANELTGFAVAGADKVFYWASAVIESNTVLVKSPNVPKPVAVRYAWADNPDASLYNTALLPACPFRSDDWPGRTISNK